MYIFDIDGTLLYTIDSISDNINQTLKKFALKEVPTEKIREFVGNGPKVLIEKTLDYIEFEKSEKREEILVAFSNKPDSTCKKVIREIFGENYFDFILGYRKDFERKPSPEGIYIIKERFDVNFSEIFYFGDSEVDMKCGKNAGIFTVGCSWGFRERKILEACKPNLIIDSPKEISKIRRV